MPFHVSDNEFQDMAEEAYDELYAQSFAEMQNVTVCWEHQPTAGQTAAVAPARLLGLFEGIPKGLQVMDRSYNQVLAPPTKITLFKNNLEAVCSTREALRAQVKKTLWHEAAHYFGLDHPRIHELEEDHAHG